MNTTTPEDFNRPETNLSKTHCIAKRKKEHIRICSKEDVAFKKTNGFELFEFEHNALPEYDIAEIDTATCFLGKRFKLPFFIEAITGGFPGAQRINLNLAKAAQKLGIGMGVGSQRAMIKHPGLAYTYQVRDVAPDILLLGNVGAVQLLEMNADDIAALAREIGADGMAIHLNAVHEMCQPEGDRNFRGVLSSIKSICNGFRKPIVVKETGCGISAETGKRLEDCGVSCIDIAGAGGTCFAKVEYFRGSKYADMFFDWGIPTAESLMQCTNSVRIPLIASGGMRRGMECAKALAMGASLVGFAGPILKAALRSYEDIIHEFELLAEELKKTMLLVGAKDIASLRKIRIFRLPYQQAKQFVVLR